MVDPKRIEALVDKLRVTISVLDDLADRPLDEVRTDVHLMGSAKYHLVVAIEVCIDIANHVIASESLRRPADFADAFAVLGEANLLDEGLVERGREMARFRNLLVHEYGSVDDGRVLEILAEGRSDLEAFAAAAARLAVTD